MWHWQQHKFKLERKNITSSFENCLTNFFLYFVKKALSSIDFIERILLGETYEPSKVARHEGC